MGELRLSGAEFMLASAAEELGATGSTILATGECEGEFAPHLRACGYDVQHLPFARSPAFFVRFARLIRDGGYDVVHLHTERARVWYAVACALLAKPAVTTIHNEFRFGGNLRWRRSLGRKLVRALNVHIVACSQRVARNERNLFGIEPEYVPNWCDQARLTPVSDGNRQAFRSALGLGPANFMGVSIANESPLKNLAELVRAVALLAPPYRHFHIGTVSDELRAMAAQLCGDRLHFVGATQDIVGYLSAADAFVCSSTFEGGQLVLMEAAITGTICVTTEVGVAEEFRGVPGAFFAEPVGDSLAAGIRRVQALPPAEREAMGAALSRFALSRYVPSVGARRYAEIYRSLADRAQGVANR